MAAGWQRCRWERAPLVWGGRGCGADGQTAALATSPAAPEPSLLPQMKAMCVQLGLAMCRLLPARWEGVQGKGQLYWVGKERARALGLSFLAGLSDCGHLWDV